ncbi:MAG: hypothetical protein ACAI35_08800 [Candidatus Methylacidiphilales bacterium]|nr:hypothetical protein [Candidatus Methylacidiphilales bacterium]
MPAPSTVSPGVRTFRRESCPCRDSWRILLAGAVALVLICFLTGCGMFGGGKKKDSSTASTTAGNDLTTYNLMITTKTGLNKLGPDQTTPSEMYLSAGTRIRLLQSMGTSVEIETINGDRGFVSATDVGPLMQ